MVDCVERTRRAELLAIVSAPRAVANALSIQACLHVCICTCCMCVCICVYVCVCIYVYICMCICIGIRMHVYTCVYVCVCMFVHRFWVSIAVRQRVWAVSYAHVCSCAYLCVCICVYVYIYVHFFLAVSVACTLEQVFWAQVHVHLCALKWRLLLLLLIKK